MEDWKKELIEQQDIRETIAYDIFMAWAEVVRFKILHGIFTEKDAREQLVILRDSPAVCLCGVFIPASHEIHTKYKDLVRRREDKWVIVGWKTVEQPIECLRFSSNKNILDSSLESVLSKTKLEYFIRG